MEIKRETISEAHEIVVATIMQDGTERSIETSPGKWEKTWEYPELVTTIKEE